MTEQKLAFVWHNNSRNPFTANPLSSFTCSPDMALRPTIAVTLSDRAIAGEMLRAQISVTDPQFSRDLSNLAASFTVSSLGTQSEATVTTTEAIAASYKATATIQPQVTNDFAPLVFWVAEITGNGETWRQTGRKNVQVLNLRIESPSTTQQTQAENQMLLPENVVGQEMLLPEAEPIGLNSDLYNNADKACVEVRAGGIIFTTDGTDPGGNADQTIQAPSVVILESRVEMQGFRAIAMPEFLRSTHIVVLYRINTQ